MPSREPRTAAGGWVRCPDRNGPLHIRCKLDDGHYGRHQAPTIDGSVSWLIPTSDAPFRCGAIHDGHPRVWCELSPEHDGLHQHLDGMGYQWRWQAAIASRAARQPGRTE